MRITKAMLQEARSKIIEGTAKLCAIYAAEGSEGLWKEHQKRFPYYVGGKPERDMELLRQLLYDDLMRAIPDYLVH